MKKCLIGMAAAKSEDFGDNTDKFFKVNLADGKELAIPALEIEAKTPEELEKELNKLVSAFVKAL